MVMSIFFDGLALLLPKAEEMRLGSLIDIQAYLPHYTHSGYARVMKLSRLDGKMLVEVKVCHCSEADEKKWRETVVRSHVPTD
jgi:hypothetical protein